METITLSGKEYVKVSLLAKKYKYTTDYIGQLCRAEKVDAELVGRTWYVNEDSLKNHKKNRYFKNRQDDKMLKKTNRIETSRIRVEPVMTNRGTKLLKEKTANFAKKIDWKPVKYEYDESELIPETKKSKKLSVNLADSNTVKISQSTLNTNFIPDDLPTVSLKGDLKVVSADVDIDDDFIIGNKDLSFEKASGIRSDSDKVASQTTKNDTQEDSDYGVKGKVEEIETGRHMGLLFIFFKTIIFLMILFLISLLVALVSLNFSVSNSESFFEKGVNFSVDFFNF